MKRSTVDISNDLAREESRLADVERTREQIRTRVEALRLELEIASTPLPARPASTEIDKVPRSATDKVELFRSLFRGRLDVFPARFVSKRTKKPGYAPMCSTSGNPEFVHSGPVVSVANAQTRLLSP